MRKDAVLMKPIYSSFFSCETDTEKLIRTLFVDSKPYSDKLKRLLIINNPDCLDQTNQDYQNLIDSKPLSALLSEGYVRISPKTARKEFENIKSYILIFFDDFTSNSVDPTYKDCIITFDIICYDDEWELDGLKLRPLQIAGYIDGILNSLTDQNKVAWQNRNSNRIKLSGMGEYSFLGLSYSALNQDISMYTMVYQAMHFTQDNHLEGYISIENEQ